MRGHLSDLIGKNIVVYDLEIQKTIGDQPDGSKIGWNDHDRMGISVGVLFDYETGDFNVHMQDNMGELVERLNRADMVVAFNQIGFDNKLLRASGFPLKSDQELMNYDMLLEVRKGMGYREGGAFPKGCKLDDCLKGTFGEKFMKTANGEEAPKMFQAGQIGKLTSYCVADVTREKALFEWIWMTGIAKTPLHGVHTLRPPQEVLEWAVSQRKAG
jgi:DEAD/DEAH box helicase domain-containing protein